MANVVKVSGITDDLLALMDVRWRERHFSDRSEYVRELIRRDAAAGDSVHYVLPQETPPHDIPPDEKSLADTIRKHFGHVQDEVERLGITEEEVARDVSEAISEVRAERRQRREAAEMAEKEGKSIGRAA